METNIHSTLIRHQIGADEQQAVDARALHAFLENGDDFSNWFRDRVSQYGFIDGLDYVEVSGKTPGNPSGGRPRRDYALTTDMAKELCMVERNAKGKEARLYFINMERQAKALADRVPKSLPEALRLAAELSERAEKQQALILELSPKADFCDRVADHTDCQNINEVAKVLGTGEGRLWKFLKDQKIVFKNGHSNAAYQQYIDRDYFKQIQGTYTKNGQEYGYTRLYVTGKGLIWLQQRWDAVHGEGSKKAA
jgi:anti-repressor protein